MADLLHTDWFIWGIGLILGFQILVVVLGEAIYRADREGRPLASIFRAIRNGVLPFLIFYVFLSKIVGLEAESATMRSVATLFWISVIYAVLLFVNVLLFEQAAAGTWRSRAPKLFQDLLRVLLVVIGAALVMELAGMSMVLGAFIAGMLLADSEFRHQLEADIGPFKGLLLGLFFIAVGMSVNIGLLLESPLRIMIMVVLLMAAKAAVLVPLAHKFGMCKARSAWSLAASMSQGGEFAFVLFGIAAGNALLPSALIDELILVVALSMLITPFAYMAAERYGTRKAAAVEPEYDDMDDEHNDVIIAGFGRVGQIVARLLRVVDRPFTALEIDSSQVDVVRRYGNVVHYGDASRLDILRAAGAEHAKLFVLVIDDIEASMRTAEAVTQHFPHLKIIARARNRRHVHKLMDLGIEHIFRETFLSSLAISKEVIASIGVSVKDTSRAIDFFRERDEQLLNEQHAFHQSEEKLLQSSRDTAAELDLLLKDDARG